MKLRSFLYRYKSNFMGSYQRFREGIGEMKHKRKLILIVICLLICSSLVVIIMYNMKGNTDKDKQSILIYGRYFLDRNIDSDYIEIIDERKLRFVLSNYDNVEQALKDGMEEYDPKIREILQTELSYEKNINGNRIEIYVNIDIVGFILRYNTNNQSIRFLDCDYYLNEV